MSALTFGSLFAGIGGMDLGLERAGMKCAWQVEINPYAQRVLAKHWPDVPKFDDVRQVGMAQLGYVDLIAGGFPCQDISNAGKQAGIDGERSGLWSEFARIIREVRPRFVLVENVAALLGRGLGRVLGDLAASGFDAEWDCIPASALGAPHRRDRLFIFAHANRNGLRTEQEPQRWSGGASLSLVNGEIGKVADAESERHEGRQNSDSVRGRSRGIWARNLAGDGELYRSTWATEPGVGRVAHGVPNRVDRLRGLGNAVVPQVAEFIGRRIVEVCR